MSTVMLNSGAARDDLRAVGAPRLEDGFLVTPIPAEPICSLSCEWTGMRYVGTNPTLWDAGDPAVLALVIEANHDYPSEDVFFALMENGG